MTERVTKIQFLQERNLPLLFDNSNFNQGDLDNKVRDRVLSLREECQQLLAKANEGKRAEVVAALYAEVLSLLVFAFVYLIAHKYSNADVFISVNMLTYVLFTLYACIATS